jgi:hypothetical protein
LQHADFSPMGHALILAARSKAVSTPSLLAFLNILNIWVVDSQMVTSSGSRAFLGAMVASLSVFSCGIYPPYG